jgi:UDP-glucose 4-epimerase
MRALVTGAAGFIGSHLAASLVADGHEVVGFDDLSDGAAANLERAPGVRFVRGDLRDAEAVRSAMTGCEVVFHHGAKRSVPRSIREPELFTDVNVRGTLHVLLAAREEGARVVSASSSSVYGDQPRFPLVETMLPVPRSPYAAGKLAGEAYCRAFTLSMDVPTVSLRYFNVYGPGQDPASEYAAVVPRFALACLTGARPIVHGDGAQARDFTYIDDVVEANLLSARAGDEAQGLAFNIGGGAEPTSVNDVLRIVAELTDSTPDPDFEPPREGDVRRTEADVSLARRLLGYDPRVGMREGLERTVEHLRETIAPGERGA